MKNKIWLMAFALFCFAITVIYIIGNNWANYGLVTNLLYLAFPLITVMVILWTRKQYGSKSINGKIMMLWAVAMIAWFVGEFLWVLFESFLGGVSYPSIIDVIFLLADPLIVVACLFSVKNLMIQWDKKNIITFLFPLIFLVGIVLVFSAPYVYDSEALLVEHIFNIWYLLSDLMLVVAASILFLAVTNFGHSKLIFPWLLLLMGVFLTLIGDVLYTYFFDQYESFSGHWRLIDLLWIYSYICFIVGIGRVGMIIKNYEKKVIK